MAESEKRRDLLAALTSGFVATLALGASIYNVYLQRLQVRAQVWPHVTWSYSNHDGFSYGLENEGVGPAIIKGASLTVDGKPAKTWKEAIALAGSGDPDVPGLLERKELQWTRSSFSHRVLGVGASLRAFELTRAVKPDLARSIQERVKVELCYCSTLDECWTTSGFISRSVASCPVGALTFED